MVRLLFVSGGDRVVDEADGARLEGLFFVVTRRHSRTGESETVLTLPTSDIVGAEIVINGTVTNYVAGGGKRPHDPRMTSKS
jgi:hypothetical protein